MNYWILIVTLLSSSFTMQAKELEDLALLTPTRDSSIHTSSLSPQESMYTFTFTGLQGLFEGENSYYLNYSIDGINGNANLLLEDQSVDIKTTPGKHVFQFFVRNHYEIYTDSIESFAHHNDFYTIEMMFELMQPADIMEKPVIYLYSDASTKVDFKIDVKGNDPFYYPTYRDGWSFIAQPNGELKFDEKTYNYLFWEASGAEPLQHDEAKNGFIVEGTNIVQFLEEKLSEAGLTSKEQADFITYWAPRMLKNNYNLIHFKFNEDCNELATFDITPKPDNIYRIYMKWSQIDSSFDIEPQKIEKVNRDGFSVLEWGGQESNFRRIICSYPPPSKD